ncbi:unnamed protein product [Cylicocyclus nassatus]|uniref:Uncharacterized protein n=1 Tax=Cylicocyclus nassatus TaxID=53992 RepID=A0AA36M2B5_CYLNA|nr:unnamed protein product [Cylicocyclus nassatus]
MNEDECRKDCPKIQKFGRPLSTTTTVTSPTSTTAASSSDASAASEASSSSEATSTTTEANVIDDEVLVLCKKMNAKKDNSTRYACKRDGKHFPRVPTCERHCRGRPELCRLDLVNNEDRDNTDITINGYWYDTRFNHDDNHRIDYNNFYCTFYNYNKYYYCYDRYNTTELKELGRPLPTTPKVTPPTSTTAASSSDASAASEASSSSEATSTTTEANVIDEEVLVLCKKMNAKKDNSTRYACKRDGKHFPRVPTCERHCRGRPELCRLDLVNNEDRFVCVRESNRSISYDVRNRSKCEDECSEKEFCAKQPGEFSAGTQIFTCKYYGYRNSAGVSFFTSKSKCREECPETAILSSKTTASSEVSTRKPMPPSPCKLTYS